MSGRSRKEQLAKRRKAVKEQLARRRALAREKTADARARQRWRTLLLIVIVFILLALCCNCNCEGPPPEPSDPVVVVPPEPEIEPVPPAPITGKIPKRKRPPYQNEAPKPLPWLGAFRMQVAARSPRLAECFVGIDRPGTLKWTTSVEPREGRVSEHEFEPMLMSADLTKKERACVVAVLSDPPYKLKTGEEPTTPSRVGMVIEF